MTVLPHVFPLTCFLVQFWVLIVCVRFVSLGMFVPWSMCHCIFVMTVYTPALISSPVLIILGMSDYRCRGNTPGYRHAWDDVALLTGWFIGHKKQVDHDSWLKGQNSLIKLAYLNKSGFLWGIFMLILTTQVFREERSKHPMNTLNRTRTSKTLLKQVLGIPFEILAPTFMSNFLHWIIEDGVKK